MKQVGLLFAVIFAMTNIGDAKAQSAARIVTPAPSAETSRVIGDAVSKSANDALKSDQKSNEMKKKAKKIEADVKQGKK